jgi:bis(5'-nucleosyl)-tetraphosphatase (symmetrical)
MALYLIGDVQGCDAALGRLLDELAFSPSRDRLVLLGDLVNRGPRSLAVLRRVQALGDAATCLLGNHDLHLLAVALGVRPPHRSDTWTTSWPRPTATALLDWVRHQPLAWRERGVLMVHAGVLPQWTCAQTLALAGEVQAVLRGPDWGQFLRQMYGNEPAAGTTPWRRARLRVIVNALTRLRFCTPDGAWSSPPRKAAAARRRATCPGSTCRAAHGGSDRWRSATGRRWAGWAGPTDLAGHRLRLGRLPERRAPGDAGARTS